MEGDNNYEKQPQEESSSILSLLLRNWKIVLGILFVGWMFFGRSTPSSDNEVVTYEETLDPTQGVIAEIEEVDSNLFKITDETIIPRKENSIVIATFMDSTVDTFTLEELELIEANEPNTSRGSFMRRMLFGGMMGYMMGRTLGSPLRSSAYKNQSAFNKSTAGTEKMKSSATRTKKPVSGKKGFGSRKSSRSYGG